VKARELVADVSLVADMRSRAWAVLRSVCTLVDDAGISIVAVTHDLGLAWNITNRIAVVYLGRIAEVGDAEQVLSPPRHPYTKALLSVVPETGGMKQQILVGFDH
jgi:ABC-type dipeptide/oligopeptide/nickel transport system ATPase component